MMQRNVRAQGVSDERVVSGVEMREECLEVAVECSHFQRLGVFGISVPAKVECDHAVVSSECGAQVIPPVEVGSAAV